MSACFTWENTNNKTAFGGSSLLCICGCTYCQSLFSLESEFSLAWSAASCPLLYERGIFSSLRGVLSCLDPAQTKLSPLHLCDIFYIRPFDLSSTLSFSQIHFKKNIHFLKNILLQLDLFQVIVYFYWRLLIFWNEF